MCEDATPRQTRPGTRKRGAKIITLPELGLLILLAARLAARRLRNADKFPGREAIDQRLVRT